MADEIFKYLDYGQKSFNFLVTPSELASVLSVYHLVIESSRVPRGYTETERAEFLKNYEALYNMLASGKQIVWKRDCDYFKSIGITSELSRCNYKKYDGKGKYLLADFDEPVPQISPMVLTVNFDESGKIHCSTSYTAVQFAECFFGMKLTYRTKIQFREGDDYGELRTTAGLAGDGDYNGFIEKIKGITATMRLKYASGAITPGIRISKQAKEEVGNCFLFQKYNLSL